MKDKRDPHLFLGLIAIVNALLAVAATHAIVSGLFGLLAGAALVRAGQLWPRLHTVHVHLSGHHFVEDFDG